MRSLSSFMNTTRFNFLYIDRCSFGHTWMHPGSAIPYNMLRYIINESVEFVINGKTAIVRKRQMPYIPEGCWLSCKALEGTFAFYSTRFTTSVFYEGANFLREYYNFPPVMDVGEGIEPYFSDIYKWVRTDKKPKSFHVRGTLDTLIASLANILDSDEPDDVKMEIGGLEYNLKQIRKRVKESAARTDPRVQTIIDYITLNPTGECTSDKLDGMAGVAGTTLRRLFKEAIGKTVIELIRQVCLTTAAGLLLVFDDPMNCIVHDVGFEGTNHFIRVFRRAFGTTLERYRETSQGQE